MTLPDPHDPIQQFERWQQRQYLPLSHQDFLWLLLRRPNWGASALYGYMLAQSGTIGLSALVFGGPASLLDAIVFIGLLGYTALVGTAFVRMTPWDRLRSEPRE